MHIFLLQYVLGIALFSVPVAIFILRLRAAATPQEVDWSTVDSSNDSNEWVEQQ